MVLLTLLSTVALALGVARLAVASGGDAVAGILVLTLPGVVRLLGWTGPEIAAAALACLAVAAALSGREWQAIALLSAAVLFRETLLLVAVGLALARRLRCWTIAVPSGVLAVLVMPV